MKLLPTFVAGVLCLGLTGSALAADAPKTQREKRGYALGATVAQEFKKDGIDLDPQFFAQAVKDTLGGATLQMTPAQIQEVLVALQKEIQARAGAGGGSSAADAQTAAREMESRRTAAAKNHQDGEAFLKDNATKPGVQTLPDGLQYKVIRDGAGPQPVATDKVTVKYKGTLIDGTVFDDSEKHGGTATFGVGDVIPGWTEALQKMRPGAKWELFVPAALAYGDQPVGATIGPGSTLIFDVELIATKK